MKLRFFIHYTTAYGEQLFISYRTGLTGKKAIEQPMEFLNNEFWTTSIQLKEYKKGFTYHYFVIKNDGSRRQEQPQKRKQFNCSAKNKELQFIDTWCDSGSIENIFARKPFHNIFLNKNQTQQKLRIPKQCTHIFKVKAPLLTATQAVCIIGSSPNLKNWQTKKPFCLSQSGEDWFIALDLSGSPFPIAYKFGIYDTEQKTFLQYEGGNNRVLFHTGNNDTRVVVDDGFLRVPYNTWKGAGMAIPLFSLRSKNSLGVGDFSDLKLLVDWVAEAGLKLIQLLPVNDTIATNSKHDAYPYAAISAFALHPLYANLEAIAGKENKSIVQGFKKKLKTLEKKEYVDYEKLMAIKTDALQQLYRLIGKASLASKTFHTFYQKNEDWLLPYAAFSYLRDKFKTADFSQWSGFEKFDHSIPEKIMAASQQAADTMRFYFFVQYQLHSQLQETVEYAHRRKVALKGDIPIGIAANSCDAWQCPAMVDGQYATGAPPDAFSEVGQHWGFPIYNWQQIEEDGFAWWKRRLQKLSEYFDAVRLDHILGFFRIWAIPQHSVQGVMGHFIPCEAVHINEFGEKGIWFDYQRYCRPYITDKILEEIFATDAEQVKEQFLVKNDFDGYDFISEFDTQQKIQSFIANEKNNTPQKWEKGLFQLAANIILLEDENNGELFHFRILMETTSSFRELMPPVQQKLKALYENYFFERQNDCWQREALQKLPILKNATKMLVCGEDLGMVPSVVPSVMASLGILSLTVQRMPKNGNDSLTPYLSVVTPSTHDMSTIREWWEENLESTQAFYKNELHQWGKAPVHCTTWISRAIILQQLASPAMWSIFQLQDILGMHETLRRKDFTEERINNPAQTTNNWQYRMHITLEELLKDKKFTKELREAIAINGRI